MLAVSSVLLFSSCSSKPNDYRVPSSGTPSRELDEQLRSASQSAGLILVADADGKYWLIRTLAIVSVNNNRISLQPHYGRLAVATGHGFTPRQIADMLQQAIETGTSPFIYNEGAGKQLSGETWMPTNTEEIMVAAILSQCRFMGWGYNAQGVWHLPECSPNEVPREGRADRQGTAYYCCTP